MKALDGVKWEFTASARLLGLCSSAAIAALIAAYAITLAVGFWKLESPDKPIGDPMFWILEALIIAMSPALVALMAAVWAWAPARMKAFNLASLVFMGLLAGLTCSVHFSILTLGRHPAFIGEAWHTLVFSFKWPSLVYAADILAWDVFFPLSLLFAAPSFSGGRLAVWIRGLMIAAAVLSLAGLSGVVLGDMRYRNIGIIGYVGVFFFVAVLLAALFHRAAPGEDRSGYGSIPD